MMSALARRVLGQLQAFGNFGAGARMGVAVSGGADSVALLLLLHEISKSSGLVLAVLHLNHRLRGKASDADERFVQQLAKKLECEFHAASTDISRFENETRNIEDAGRRARYAWFREAADRYQLSSVATAHTADDQAETVLAHILRGTGIAGLEGVHRQAGVVVRPLLAVRRRELREYLKQHSQGWREDRSNQDVSRTRARIRKKLLPLLEKEFQSGVVRHLGELAERARESSLLMGELVGRARQQLVVQEGDMLRISARDLLNPLEGGTAESCRTLSALLIAGLASEVKQQRGQLTSRHIESVLRLAEQGENGKVLELPGGLRVCRERDALLFFPVENRATRPVYSHQIREFADSCSVAVPQLQCVFRFTVIDWPSDWRDTKLTGTVLDRARLKFPLVLRNWWPGDRMHPLGRQRPHKLKHLLTGLHLSKWQRESWPVVESSGRIAWSRGLPVAAEFAPSERTRAGIVIAVDTAPGMNQRAEALHAKR